jgi:hypothetical protein
MQLKTRINEVRGTLTDRRSQRNQHRRLAAELASYATTAERAELDAILERHSDDEARDVREILARQDFARHYAATASSAAGSTR